MGLRHPNILQLYSIPGVSSHALCFKAAGFLPWLSYLVLSRVILWEYSVIGGVGPRFLLSIN